MSRTPQSRFYTVLGWVVFTLAKRYAKKRLTPDTGGKGKKLLAAGAVAAVAGGAAYAAKSADSSTHA
jgi:hypothetical protein